MITYKKRYDNALTNRQVKQKPSKHAMTKTDHFSHKPHTHTHHTQRENNNDYILNKTLKSSLFSHVVVFSFVFNLLILMGLVFYFGRSSISLPLISTYNQSNIQELFVVQLVAYYATEYQIGVLLWRSSSSCSNNIILLFE